MINYKKSLKALIIEKALIKNKNFILSSGLKTNYYFDLRKISYSKEGLKLIGNILNEYLKDYNFKYIGGPATSAIPVIIAYLLYSKKDIEGFYIRKKSKKYGLKNLIEGNIEKNSSVVLIDDVLTTGKSLVYAYNIVKKLYNCNILRILTIIDRSNKDIIIKDFKEISKVIQYESIFKVEDLLCNLK